MQLEKLINEIICDSVQTLFYSYNCNLAWANLNRLRTGLGRCAGSLDKWRILPSPECDCSVPRKMIQHLLYHYSL